MIWKLIYWEIFSERLEQSVKYIYIYISEISIMKILNFGLKFTDDLEINLLRNF